MADLDALDARHAPSASAGATAEFRRRLVAAVDAGLRARLAQTGASELDALGDPDALAATMVAAVPLTHPFDVELGPFYDTAGLCRWWDVSRQAVADRVRRGTLLACRTQDGHLLYPSFQFARDGQVRPGIGEAVAVLARSGADGWTVAVWFTTPTPAFDGQSAVDHLVVHRGAAAAVRRVVEQARSDAASWAA